MGSSQVCQVEGHISLSVLSGYNMPLSWQNKRLEAVSGPHFPVVIRKTNVAAPSKWAQLSLAEQMYNLFGHLQYRQNDLSAIIFPNLSFGMVKTPVPKYCFWWGTSVTSVTMPLCNQATTAKLHENNCSETKRSKALGNTTGHLRSMSIPISICKGQAAHRQHHKAQQLQEINLTSLFPLQTPFMSLLIHQLKTASMVFSLALGGGATFAEIRFHFEILQHYTTVKFNEANQRKHSGMTGEI